MGMTTVFVQPSDSLLDPVEDGIRFTYFPTNHDQFSVPKNLPDGVPTRSVGEVFSFLPNQVTEKVAVYQVILTPQILDEDASPGYVNQD